MQIAEVLPTRPEEWIALAAVGVTLFSWAFSSIARTITYRREQAAREWLRLQELAGILGNHQRMHGAWVQMAAVEELTTLKVPRAAIERIANHAIEVWKGAPEGDLRRDLSDRLKALLDNPRDCLESADRSKGS